MAFLGCSARLLDVMCARFMRSLLKRSSAQRAWPRIDVEGEPLTIIRAYARNNDSDRASTIA